MERQYRTTEQIIADVITGGADKEMAIAKIAVRTAVQKVIWCPKCQGILDEDDAVYVETPKERPIGVFCAVCWENLRKEFRDDAELKWIEYTTKYGKRHCFVKPDWAK